MPFNPIAYPPALTRLRPTHMIGALFALAASLGLSQSPAAAMGLMVDAPAQTCSPNAGEAAPPQAPPAQAGQPIPDSQVVPGRQDIAWVWLGSPTRRYPHGALGSPVHAGSVHVRLRSGNGRGTIIEHGLPLNRVYEDRVPRILDLDGDGREEIVLIEADTFRGASLVVLGIDLAGGEPRLVERARGPFAGSSFRWLNPVGVADFDGDGRLDLASVITPHIGGVLQLLHYRPPSLEPFARALDVSNHRMGSLEQELAVIVQQPGERPTIILPDMSRRALHALRWDAPGQWTELADLKPLPGLIERLTPHPSGACATLDDGRSLRVTLTP